MTGFLASIRKRLIEKCCFFKCFDQNCSNQNFTRDIFDMVLNPPLLTFKEKSIPFSSANPNKRLLIKKDAFNVRHLLSFFKSKF